jgi:hypothetical protein
VELASNVDLEGWFSSRATGHAYKCPWWADEQVNGLAYLQGKVLRFTTGKYLVGARYIAPLPWRARKSIGQRLPLR